MSVSSASLINILVDSLPELSYSLPSGDSLLVDLSPHAVAVLVLCSKLPCLRCALGGPLFAAVSHPRVDFLVFWGLIEVSVVF